MNERTEAERLRIILHAFAHANPAMTLQDALPMILATEKKTVELEPPRVVEKVVRVHVLKDTSPETVAAWINTQVDIVALMDDTKKINAIKEVRARVSDPSTASGYLGLKEAKDGVEKWQEIYRGVKLYAPHMVYPSSSLMTKQDVADHIDRQPAIIDLLREAHLWRAAGTPPGDSRRHNMINAIKAIRTTSGAGLKEAKYGAEYWIKTRL